MNSIYKQNQICYILVIIQKVSMMTKSMEMTLYEQHL